MRTLFYPRLAWDGIRKNRRLYGPYLLTCVCMAAMHYLLGFLASPAALALLPRGKSSVEMILTLGRYVMLVFSLVFLYYTHSFLIRRRQREFGLDHRVVLCVDLACNLVVVFRDLVAEVSGTGMQHDPEVVFPILLKLDEVIAASERADLMTCRDVLRLYDGELVDVVALRQIRLILQVLMVVEPHGYPVADTRHDLLFQDVHPYL